jgi:hypothetical protein
MGHLTMTSGGEFSWIVWPGADSPSRAFVTIAAASRWLLRWLDETGS